MTTLMSFVAAPALERRQSPRPHPDAVLLRLGEMLHRQFNRERTDDPDKAAAQHQRTKAIVAAIETAPPASTIAGLKAKAMAVAWCCADDLAGDGLPTNLRLALSIVRDLNRMQERSCP